MQIRRGAIGSIAATLAAVIGVVAWRGGARSQEPRPPEDQLPRFAQSAPSGRPPSARSAR